MEFTTWIERHKLAYFQNVTVYIKDVNVLTENLKQTELSFLIIQHKELSFYQQEVNLLVIYEMIWIAISLLHVLH